MFKSTHDIIRSFNELAELSDGEAEAAYRAISRRDRKQEWLRGLTGFAIFLAWTIFFWKSYGWLERHHGWDVLDLGLWGYALLAVMGFPGALTVASIFVYQSWKCSLRRAIETHLKDRLCLWCAYCLTGLEAAGNRVRCPECGQPSPVRNNTE